MRRFLLAAFIFISAAVTLTRVSGFSHGAVNFYVATGDSITAGSDSGGVAYPTISNYESIHVINKAVPGTYFTGGNIGGPSIDALVNTKGIVVVSILLGYNDFFAGLSTSTYQTRYQSWLTDRHAAGVKTVCATILPASTPVPGINGFSAWRATNNTAIRSWLGGFCDAIADFASDPTMGPDAAADNVLLYPDGVHPSVLGQTNLAPVMRAAVVSLFP